MHCTECGSEKSHILETRDHHPTCVEFDAVYRRRECKECGYRWTTYELKADQLDLE